MAINGSDKGKRAERELADLLTARFKQPFSRSVGSGNRWAQVGGMSTAAKHTLSGDLSCPDGFKWVIECKSGYEDKLDLSRLAAQPILESFLEQVSQDALRSGRKPLLCLRQARRPWVCFVRAKDAYRAAQSPFRLMYGEWVGLPLNDVLAWPDVDFFG